MITSGLRDGCVSISCTRACVSSMAACTGPTPVISGLMQVQLETEVPVFSVVLTPHHFHEHEQHQQYFFKHFLTKGAEAAQACVHTLASLQSLA